MASSMLAKFALKVTESLNVSTLIAHCCLYNEREGQSASATIAVETE